MDLHRTKYEGRRLQVATLTREFSKLVPGPAAKVSPGDDVLNVQTLQPQSSESQTLWVKHSNLCFNKPSM